MKINFFIKNIRCIFVLLKLNKLKTLEIMKTKETKIALNQIAVYLPYNLLIVARSLDIKSTNIEGDSFEGFMYIKIEGLDKYLKEPYQC